MTNFVEKLSIVKARKTLSSRLATRYQLILRNEENFAERHAIGITGAKVILFSVIDPAEALRNENKPLEKPSTLELSATDSSFRRNFEQSELSLITNTAVKYEALQSMFFFTPITGFISDKYDAKKGHLGVDIVAKVNEPVKNIADGMVIFSSWTQDSGHVIMLQHKGNLISVYKHNSHLYKKVGTFVNAGEIIAIVGNSG
ncbi:MAG: M23 family metallopeptidase, partial [Cytophagia bacterium]|nr:M23 family metallopeptidase [Cytophagia bacterium]